MAKTEKTPDNSTQTKLTVTLYQVKECDEETKDTWLDLLSDFVKTHAKESKILIEANTGDVCKCAIMEICINCNYTENALIFVDTKGDYFLYEVHNDGVFNLRQIHIDDFVTYKCYYKQNRYEKNLSELDTYDHTTCPYVQQCEENRVNLTTLKLPNLCHIWHTNQKTQAKILNGNEAFSFVKIEKYIKIPQELHNANYEFWQDEEKNIWVRQHIHEIGIIFWKKLEESTTTDLNRIQDFLTEQSK